MYGQNETRNEEYIVQIEETPKKSNRMALKLTAAAMAVALIAGAAGGAVGYSIGGVADQTVPVLSAAPTQAAATVLASNDLDLSPAHDDLRNPADVYEQNQDYVKFAQVKGLSRSAVQRKHIFRNAIIPLVIYLPSDLLLIISGSLVIETLYSIPGTGGLLTTAIKNQDNNLVQILVLMYAVLSVLGVFLGDLLIAFVDPRIKLTQKED